MRTIAHLLGGDVTGPNSVSAPAPGHSPKDRSLSIRVDPDAPGGFLVHCFAGDDPIACKEYVRQELGLPHGHGKPTRGPHRSNPALGEVRVAGKAINGDRRRADQRAKAEFLWTRGKSISGTPAERYLREARRYGGPLPPTLRYLAPRAKSHQPALIAAFGMPDDLESGVLDVTEMPVTGVHLTLVRPDGTGKAGTGRDKLMIGKSVGKPIVVSPPKEHLVISEGIEDALSLFEATGLECWAAGAAGRLPALAGAIPDDIERVTIVADPDNAGLTNAVSLYEKLKARGLGAQIMVPETEE